MRGRPRAAHWLHVENAELTQGMSQSLAALHEVGTPKKGRGGARKGSAHNSIPPIGAVGPKSTHPGLRPRTAPDVMLQVIATAPLAAPALPPMQSKGGLGEGSSRLGALDSARRVSGGDAGGMSARPRTQSDMSVFGGPESPNGSPNGKDNSSKGEFLGRYDVWLKKMEQDKWDDDDDEVQCLTTHAQYVPYTCIPYNTHAHKLCDVLIRHTLVHHALMHHTLMHHTLLHHTLMHHTLMHHTLLHHTLVHHALMHHTLVHHTLLHTTGVL
jgi:hypothetical protein